MYQVSTFPQRGAQERRSRTRTNDYNMTSLLSHRPNFGGLVRACPFVHICGWLYATLCIGMPSPQARIALYCTKSKPRGIEPRRSRTQEDRIGQVESPGKPGILRRQS